MPFARIDSGNDALTKVSKKSRGKPWVRDQPCTYDKASHAAVDCSLGALNRSNSPTKLDLDAPGSDLLDNGPVMGLT